MQVSAASLELFAFGQLEAASRGLLLVDTKYEFGRDADGNILLVDEVRCGDACVPQSPTLLTEHRAGLTLTATLTMNCDLGP